MVLKLDPRYPLVWRTPTSLQLGVAAPVVVLDDVTPADERIIAALSAGVSRPGLAMIGRAAGASEPDVDALLALMAPALAAPLPTPAEAVTITGSGPTVDRVTEALRAAGLTVRVASDADSAGSHPCDFAIAVGHFVLAPELHGCGSGATSRTCPWCSATPPSTSDRSSSPAAVRASTACSATAPMPTRRGPPYRPSCGGGAAAPSRRSARARSPHS
jgi:hypothetical protein